MKILLATTVLFVFNVVAYGQVSISGKVVDKKNKPLEYATIVVKKDSVIMANAFTDSMGNYTAQNIPTGSYNISCSFINDKIEILLDVHKDTMVNIQLNTNKQLEQVMVAGKKPLIERKVDRLIFNVENAIAASGENGFDLLKIIPGVVINAREDILVKGKTGIQCLIDDKPILLTGEQLRNYLKSLSAENIKSIELITNPSAKYDAQGIAAILNIRLKKITKQGINGSISPRYTQGVYGNYGLSGNINYKTKSFNIFSNVNIFDNMYFDNGFEQRRYAVSPTPLFFVQNYFDKRNTKTAFLRIGTDYTIDNHQTIGVILEGTTTNQESPFAAKTDVKTNNNIDSFFLLNSNTYNTFKNYDINLNYIFRFDSLGQSLIFLYDNASFEDRQLANYLNQFYLFNNTKMRDDEIFGVKNPTNVNINSFKVDYTLPFNKGNTLEIGIKSSIIKTDNDIVYTLIKNNQPFFDSLRSNHFIYKENINAIYANWTKKYKSISIQAGLRLEETYTTGESKNNNPNNQKYWNLFPSFFIQKDINDNNQISINYSRRINRPNYEDLNPFQFYFDPYSFKAGNPYLQPELANSFEISYLLKNKYTLAFNYSNTTQLITEISTQDDNTKIMQINVENLGRQNDYNLALNFPIQIAKYWDLTTEVDAHRTELINNTNGIILNRRNNSYRLWLSNNFILSKTATIVLDGTYNSSIIQGIDKFKPFGNVYIGFKKQLFNNTTTLNLGITDIFLEFPQKTSILLLQHIITKGFT